MRVRERGTQGVRVVEEVDILNSIDWKILLTMVKNYVKFIVSSLRRFYVVGPGGLRTCRVFLFLGSFL